jgi:hypothetical protein
LLAQLRRPFQTQLNCHEAIQLACIEPRRARDRSGNPFGAAKRLERIARFFTGGTPVKNAPKYPLKVLWKNIRFFYMLEQ